MFSVKTDISPLTGDAKSWLKKAEVFSALGETDLKIVSDHSEICTYNTGNSIFEEGAASDALFIIVDGTVNITRKENNGSHTVIAELIPGDSFGELDLLTGALRNATAVSGTDAKLLRFPLKGESHNSAFENHPSVSARVLHSFLKVIAGRIRNANILIKENSPWVQELRRQVYGDKLTGLFNKTYLEEELPGMLKDPSKPVTLLLMKPDNFKYINDTFGHEAGDESLKMMASELNHYVNEFGTALKYMGNELGVIMPGANRQRALEAATEIRSIFNNLNITSVTGGTAVQVTVSIGIAVFPEHGDNSESLISKAHELPLVGRARGGNLILFPEDNV